MTRRLVAVALLLLLGGAPAAHEIRTAYLQIDEVEPGLFEVVWRQPLTGARLEPVLPKGCEPLSAPSPSRDGDTLVERWATRCDMRSGTVGIIGLEAAHAETIVGVSHLDGDGVQQVLRPGQPRLALGESASGAGHYFLLGLEHMLFGIDHVLFVAGLVLFIRSPWLLVKTVTAFTVAHSITLAASVLELVKLPQGPVEVVIALSILFLARELMVPAHRQSRLTRATPWMMAFAFGLLHGFGFAGALAEIGLPTGRLAIALLSFNLGIEAAQLAVIAALLGAGALMARLLATRAVWLTEKSFAAGLGCVAAFWTIDRVVALV